MQRWLPLLLIITLVFPLFVHADELDDTTNTIAQKQTDLKNAQAALQTAKSKESQLGGSLGGLQQSLNVAIAEINVKQAEVDSTLAELDRRSVLLKRQEDNRTDRIRQLYRQVKWGQGGQFMALLSADNFSAWTRLMAFQTSALHDDKSRIANLDGQISELAKERDALKAQTDQLNANKADLQHRADIIRSQISIVQSQKQGYNNQIVSLGNDIKGLTARQQQLVQAKIAANAARSTVGDSATISTPMPPAPYTPAQGGSFAFASYGYPHRVGMNQYGAYGRAKAGQDYQTILHAYYGGTAIGQTSVPDTIDVQGYGTIAFEDNYMKGISEMPRSWSMEALKAQAVAARTYALKWVSDHPGQSICTTESCQVYNGGRINGTGSDDLQWYQAVSETRGVVLTAGGSLINAWFSSTDGGYTQSSAQVWGGVTSYTQMTRDYAGSWPSGAYDKDSPWFHKAWGSRDGGAYNPWMTKAETLDILNAALLYDQTGKTSDSDYDLSPTASGGSTPDQIVTALNKRGIQPIGDFQLITVNQNDNTGQTETLNALGGPRTVTKIAGANVKKVFNLRSLGTLTLESSLFDVITQ